MSEADEPTRSSQEKGTSSEEKYRSVVEELRRAAEQAQRAGRMAEEFTRVRRTLEQRERTIAKLRHRLAVSEWKLASLSLRRWMRLGSELSAARRRPSTIPLLPVRLLRVVTSRAEPLVRPVPPPELSSSDLENQCGDDSRSSSVEAIIPSRDISALVLLDDELRRELSYEVQVFDLDRGTWHDQLSSLAPHLLIIDSETAAALDSGELDELLTAARGADVRSVLWGDRPGALPGPPKARFDVLCVDGKLPADDFDGQLVVERRGRVQPRLHNPIGGHQRSKDTGDVRFRSRTLAGTEYEDSAALAHAAKKYKVLRVIGEVDAALAAPVLATATPLISTRKSAEVGIAVESEEDAESLEKALVGSQTLRARLTHPQMRAVMREQTIGRDVGELLGEAESERWPQIDIMVPTRRVHRLPAILENLGRQTYRNFRLFLVAHGIEFDRGEVQDKAEQAGVELAQMVSVDESVILGEVFNIGFGETDANIVAKVDDDDFYGAEYLWDLYTALGFSGAEVAGKWAHYAYLEGMDSMIYRYQNREHRFTDVVAISTLLMHREVLEVERFPAEPWGSGSLFLRALGAQGGRVFAADRWNYLYIRGADGERNTFPISDVKMLSNSHIVCRGMNVDEVVA